MRYLSSRRQRHELDEEHERGVGRDDAAGTPGAVRQVARDSQDALLAHLHVEERLVPSLDDAANTHLELERRAASNDDPGQQ